MMAMSFFFIYTFLYKENIKLYCIKKNILNYYKLKINQKFEQTKLSLRYAQNCLSFFFFADSKRYIYKKKNLKKEENIQDGFDKERRIFNKIATWM